MSARERETSATASAPRSRQAAGRKKGDDSSYFGQLGGSGPGKRARDTTDDADNGRFKRKRVETNGNGARKETGNMNLSLVDFGNLPTESLNRYLHQFGIVPYVYPSPSLCDDPPAPHELEDGYRGLSRPPSPPATTPANRPRRESKDHTETTPHTGDTTVDSEPRRSKRHEEDYVRSRVPILADRDDVHGVLADIAEQHFREHSVKEVDALSGFIRAVVRARTSQH